ncbi:SIS domain-containing protein [Streptomyces sp. JJ38]|uniref:SIS domain-containing protein n=1 Tax=Streptomyces sp. JJ38 TaxID=2738128 RepID=UPI001C5A0112|nr:SIS domain-containing protein [Streptomyces sp. JJ38]MBW1595683.1 mannose-6-phosphate isomerase [Streptomyces sp. JJ38]
MLDEPLLDDPRALADADRAALLRATAEAGARVRTAIRDATDAGLTELRPDGRPRGLLVAGPAPAAGCLTDLLAAFSHGVLPVSLLRPFGAAAAPQALRWALPGWAGPLDLLIIVTPDGAEPGLSALAEQAYRRGCTVVAVTREGTPVAGTVHDLHGLTVPVSLPPPAAAPRGEAAPIVPGSLWALLTPLLVLTDRLGLGHAPPHALQGLADRLDAVAQRCGPAHETYANPAKTLAAELAESLPVLWSEGPVAGAAARHFTTVLAALSGRPALAAELPEALTVHRALLNGVFAAGADEDDFFRDRVEEPARLQARVVLLRDLTGGTESAAEPARELAFTHDTGLSELEPTPGSSVLESAAELIATTDFATVYLTLTPEA